jgi:Recombinase zinc beta ribbon domain
LAASARRPDLEGQPGWSEAAVTALLKRRVYLGEVSCAPHIREGAHPALIDAVTWELAQRPRFMGPRKARNEALLRGLVICASCGMAMAVVPRKQHGTSVYGCHRRFGAGTCPAPAYIDAHQLERRSSP